jgi:hypothetical protein
VALDQFIKRGGIALPCNLALDDMIEIIKNSDNVSPDEARTQAIAVLVPGRDPEPPGVRGAARPGRRLERCAGELGPA